ncbi:RNA polymerase sigma factor [Enhygromyxa salina]|uniref:RNA polymerase sigma factor n=1 Tax=Enhygromyxa salina TaxID=215803 RepID=A0A2S9XQA4_9BACT|nr:sigma-70 family RNA polymerase sigma factor [Enhygromyxa salina]PRP95035.1 RNA polymerase sigma factor [Enhygromyxa salina]
MTDSWVLKIEPADFMRINRELIRYFGRRVPRADSADLAADAWLAIARCFKGKCGLRSFAFLVARKLVFEYYERRVPRQVATTPPLEDDKCPATGPGPDSLLMLAIGHEATERALAEVGEFYRSVVRLWLHGRDPMQIAAELNIPYNTVRSRLSRGLAQVRAALRAEFGAG